MENIKHDINKLPQWVKQNIAHLQQMNDYLESRNKTLEDINAIMSDPKRDWFTLPFSHDDDKPIHLWLLDKDQPLPVCALGKGDLLFVGRAKREEQKCRK